MSLLQAISDSQPIIARMIDADTAFAPDLS